MILKLASDWGWSRDLYTGLWLVESRENKLAWKWTLNAESWCRVRVHLWPVHQRATHTSYCARYLHLNILFFISSIIFLILQTQTSWGVTILGMKRSSELMRYCVDLDLMKSKGILLFIWSVTSILSEWSTLLRSLCNSSELGHPLISKLISFVLRNRSPRMATHFNLTLSS